MCGCASINVFYVERAQCHSMQCSDDDDDDSDETNPGHKNIGREGELFLSSNVQRKANQLL